MSTVLWSRPINGSREKGAAPVTRIHLEREEGRASREGSVRRDKERAVVRKKKGNDILQSPCRKPTYGLVQRHPDTHPLHIDPYVVDVNKLYSCICICIYTLFPCVWCIRVCVFSFITGYPCVWCMHVYVCSHTCECTHIHI